jgi:8-oxo-dGTP pyrophosphatase MutT (NUDIX family)
VTNLTRREYLRALLDAHRPEDALETEHLRRMRALLEGADDPFARSHFQPGHFTASAFVLDARLERILFIHHAKLKRWLQPGGHIDPGDGDVVEAVRRELREETGLQDLVRLGEGLLDVDVHAIPARPAEPAHEHFDLRFVFRAAEGKVQAGSDALDARWVSFDGIARLESDDSVRRAVRKLNERRARYAVCALRKPAGDSPDPGE